MRHGLATACLTLSFMSSLMAVQSAIADPSVKDLAARTEVRPIETLTLSDQQFLTGDKSAAKAAVIAGELRLPQGAAGRLPAVVLMHGSGGAGAREEFWSKIFNEMGIASFVVDSFSGRGLTSVSANQALLGRFNMILDAYRAHATLSAHPRIDRSRIVAHGLLARRPDHALCEPQAFPPGVGPGGRIRRLYSALRVVQPDADRRHRCERGSHPHVSRCGGRLRSGRRRAAPMSSGCGLPGATRS